MGLGKGVQTAFYINLSTRTFSPDDTLLFSSSSIGFSNEWKFKLSDAVANRIGSALYGEITFDGHEIELEGKIILDKKMDKNNFAFNLVGEMELEYEYEAEEGIIELEKSTKMEMVFGYMRNVGKNSGIGLELRNKNNFKDGDIYTSPFFAGPVAHFSGKSWWLNVGVMPQLFNAKKISGGGNLDLNNYEKVEGRMIVSFMF